MQRTNLGVEVSQEVRKYFKKKFIKTAIPRNIKLSEAPSEGLAIFLIMIIILKELEHIEILQRKCVNEMPNNTTKSAPAKMAA